MNDDRMIGPAQHELAAGEAVRNGEVAEAQVYALLAVASAINRLADAQQALADARS